MSYIQSLVIAIVALELLGVQLGPVRATSKHKLPNSPPPEYMLQLYSEVAYNSASINQKYGADAITAVTETIGKRNHFTFKLPEYNNLVAAEFHVHHSSLHFHERFLENFNTTLLEISVMLNSRIEISRQIVPNVSGWFKFSLNSETLKKTCLKHHCLDRIIVLTVFITKMDGETIKLKLHHGDMKTERKPLLILFTKENKMIGDTLNELKIVAVDDEMHNRLKRSLSDTTNDRSNCSAITQQGSCSKHPMMVQFDDIGWHGWVLAPASFNAYKCSGECAFPLGQDFNPTNHAIVQSLMTIYGPEETKRDIAMPHCTPSSYLPLSMLYINQDENVVLRNYEQMIVDSCGCR